MSTKKRTPKEQAAAEEFHKEKCCTTKWITCGIILLFIGLVLLVTAVGVYNAWDLKYFRNSTFYESCYVEVGSNNPCNTEACTDIRACTQSLYNFRPDDDQTCAVGECAEFKNGCVSNTYEGACAKQAEYESGSWVSCYEFSKEDLERNGLNCQNSGRLDPEDEWGGQHTSYIVLLVFAIIFIVVSIVFFVIGMSRCLCKKIDDDILGSTKGTGCYQCMDYDRCCYGEGTGDATIVNQQERNLPIKDNKRKKKQGTKDYEEANQDLR